MANNLVLDSRGGLPIVGTPRQIQFGANVIF
jgi:hypothetical protein